LQSLPKRFVFFSEHGQGGNDNTDNGVMAGTLKQVAMTVSLVQYGAK